MSFFPVCWGYRSKCWELFCMQGVKSVQKNTPSPQPKRADAQWPQCIYSGYFLANARTCSEQGKQEANILLVCVLPKIICSRLGSSWEWTRTRDNHEWADRSSHYYTVSHRASPRHSLCTSRSARIACKATQPRHFVETDNKNEVTRRRSWIAELFVVFFALLTV